MHVTSRTERMSPELLKVAERARREPKARFHSLAHLMDEAALVRSYERLKEEAAEGVDGVTKDEYARSLERNIRDLHERLRTKRYRHQPIRRVHIPKDGGKTRPIGISTVEDKIVQGALREVLEAVYEQDFLDCSYGCRPKRRAHDAIRALNREVFCGRVNWVLEADIKSFFDRVNRQQLLEMLQERVPDGSIRRLVGKCMHVGVLEDGATSKPEDGTPQGSGISPLLANIYLHYVLDQWFEQKVKPRLRGAALLIRYVDDFVITFELGEDAERVAEVLPKRMGRYGLELHPDKTRLIPFRRPPRRQKGGKGPGSFDFLGFTLFWRRTRKGRWEMACKTRHARLARSIQRVHDWCRRHRHWAVKDQHAALSRRIKGHFNYFGVNGNWRSMAVLVYMAKRSWFKWLNRRSQRSRLTWERFQDLYKDFPLPTPRIKVQIWGL